MVVKPGYKQTEAGVIPEDWDAKTIGNNIDLLTGFPFPSVGYAKSGVRLLRGSNVKRGQTDWTDELTQYWPDITPDLVRFQLQEADLIIAMDGSLVGRSYAQLKSDDLPALLLQRVARIRSTKKIDVGYLTSFIGSDRWIKYADSVKTITAIPHISPSDIRNFTVPLPPTIKEQHSIATALSDTDARISSIDKIIAKKRDLKQAAMQDLLTGKRRLPGFTGRWEILEMSKKSTLKARIGWQGLTTAEYLESGEYHLVTGTDFQNGHINWSTCCFVDENRYAQDKNIQLKKGDILLTKDGTIGKVGYIDYLPAPATLNSGVFVIRPINDAYDPLYFYYVLMSRIFEDFLSKLQAGSTIIHLYQKDFINFYFLAPDIDEQRAIATILSDMDAEIAALEQQRDKTRAIKQGMMQELLTGRIRLT